MKFHIVLTLHGKRDIIASFKNEFDRFCARMALEKCFTDNKYSKYDGKAENFEY